MDETKKCPVCGGDLVHPVGVYVRTVEQGTGPVIHVITHDGYRVQEPPCEAIPPRGVVIILEYLGECGHRWIELNEFYKGSTLQRWEQLNPLVGPDNVIWRD